MKFGMTIQQYQILNDLVIAPLKKQHAQVFIFGSRTGDKHHPYSDVDLLFKLQPGTRLPSGFIAKIKDDIEESKFPFKVDIVDDQSLANSYRTTVYSQMIEL